MNFLSLIKSVILVTLVAGAGITPAAAQLELVVDQLKARGQARVILHMQDPQNQVVWENSATVSDQRAAVRTMKREMVSALSEYDLTIDQDYSSLPFVGVELDNDHLSAILAMPEVAGVYPVIVERKARETEAPSLASSVPSIDVNDAWAQGYEGEEYTIAIIDGGFDVDHAMLSDKVVGEACFSATFGGDTFSQCPGGITPQVGLGAASNCPADSDRCDHGTHVASIAVGNDGSTFGVAREAQFMPIDVFSEVTNADDCSPDPAPCELTDSLAVLDALDYINENVELYNIAAVNLSFGGGANSGPCDDDPRKVVIDMLREKGVATVAAAGNAGRNGSINAPACISSAVSVGATNDGLSVASFSNFASFVDVMAPGVGIRAARAGGGLVSRSGTSMATPHVAGAFAVIRSAFPDASVGEILEAIVDSGTPVSRAGQNFEVPRLEVNQAILAMQGVNVRVFNNVIGSRTTDVGQAYIRLHNTSDEEGRVRVSLRDSETGQRLGRWVSPLIPAHASVQFNVARLESEAASDEVIATDERTYYNLVVESEFEGAMQHVLWQRQAGVLSNMTSCPDGVTGGERVLSNVHSPNIVQYPSLIRVYNSGTTSARANLDVYNASTGEHIGTWSSELLEAGAAIEVAVADVVADFEEDPDEANAVTDVESELPTHLNIELQAGFTGHLQHALRNAQSNVLTDMSTKCAFGD